jgi:putative ABC transport system permease protein
MNPIFGISGDTLVTGLPLVPAFMGIYLVFVIRSDFDLTVEASFTLGGAVSSVLLQHAVPVAVAMIAGVLLAGLAGLCTTLLHIGLRIPVILAGLVMATGLYSVNLHIMGQPTISLLGYPTLFSRFQTLSLMRYDLVTSLITAAVLSVVLALVGIFLLSDIGLALRCAGVNGSFARSQGVNTHLTTALALCSANALAGLSGALAVQQQGFADVDMGTGVLLAGIGAVLLGQFLLRPSGSNVLKAIVSVIVGTLVYRLVLAIALRVGLQATDLNAVTALILVACFALRRSSDALRKARTRRVFRSERDIVAEDDLRAVSSRRSC